MSSTIALVTAGSADVRRNAFLESPVLEVTHLQEKMAMRVTASAKMSTLRYLAGNHLRAAFSAAIAVHKIEQENDTTKFGSWFDPAMQSVTVAIVMAGAGLEASANETIQNILDKPSPLTLTTGTKLQLQALKEDRSGNSIGKYRQIAWMFDKDPDEGGAPWQDAAVLVLARNSLMHFRPVWDHMDAVKEDSKVVKALKGKVPTVEAYRMQVVFPHAFMTYGCAKWAVETVLKFCSNFAKLIEAKAKLVVPGVDFKLP